MEMTELIEKYQGVNEFVNTYLVMRSKLATHSRVAICESKRDPWLADIIYDFVQTVGDCESIYIMGWGLDKDEINSQVLAEGIDLIMSPSIRDVDGLPDELTCFSPAGPNNFCDEYRPLFFWSAEQVKQYREHFLEKKPGS